MIHHFPESIDFEGPSKFTDPFRYTPHPLVIQAAYDVIGRIETDSHLSEEFSEGKMLGVLICRQESSQSLVYVTAFSGNVGGKSHVDGFVPPIYDLTAPDGHFRQEEARISSLNKRIAELEGSDRLKEIRTMLEECRMRKDEELNMLKAAMLQSKKAREATRKTCHDAATLADLTRQSQFEKAEFRRRKIKWEKRAADLQERLDSIKSEADTLKSQRAAMSDRLQDWIFKQYIVHNSLGEEVSISGIFSGQGLVPPGGTGECAAPKMLEYAFRNGLKPLAMGEFWYGRSPDTAVRTHGRFYPSCTSKCGPLLKFMLKGIDTQDISHIDGIPHVIYDDEDIIVAEKPHGMPSVPGLDGRKSLQEWLESTHGGIHAVHRLDMDTSGVMVFAKKKEAAVELRRQFEEHTVRKTYLARLSSCPEREIPSRGTIGLPLSPDFDERPRQKVDMTQGKTALTEYEKLSVNEDGTTDVIFHPHTGRTHQLRVHSAHYQGLGCPIVGDLLYGGDGHHRLCLHAYRINFRHPASGLEMQFTGNTKMF